MEQITIEQALQLGVQHHQAGRLAQAEQVYRQILTQQPDHVVTINLLGVLAGQVGQLDASIALIRRALALNPTLVDAYNNLGNALRAKRELNEAIAAFREAIRLKPDFAEAHGNLGSALFDSGQVPQALVEFQEAIRRKPDYADAHFNLAIALQQVGKDEQAANAYQQAIRIRPGFADAHNNLGNLLYGKADLDKAIAAFRQAIRLKPDQPDAHYNLGNALADRGQMNEAIASFREVIRVRPDFVQAHCNLGNALRAQFLFDDAAAAYRQAIAVRPEFAEAHYNLAIALQESRRIDEAIAEYRLAIRFKPDFANAYTNLGILLQKKGRLDESIDAHRQAIRADPSLANAYCNLGNVLREVGRLDEGIAAYRDAIRIDPAAALPHDGLVLDLHFLPGVDPKAIYEELCRWNLQHAQPLQRFNRPHSNDRNPHRRLRVGYVSPDFRSHACSCFIGALLETYTRDALETVCYSDAECAGGADAVTARLRAIGGQWREIHGQTDEEVVERVRSDRIDILVDLAGHTAHNRLLAFARKPAPIQVTHLGFPDSTGMTAIDYRFTDALADPPGQTERYHSETLVRLPDCAWCYRPMFDSPPVDESPAMKTGVVTFGCYNLLAKVNDNVLELWSRLLREAPGSRLLMKTGALAEPTVRARVLDALKAGGVEPDRVQLQERNPSILRHLQLYGQVDIALDPFPYNGTTTTCDALWMGVPVVSLAGRTHAARVGVSLLSAVGMPEWIAQSPDDYVRIAAILASDLPRLAELRSTMRQRMQSSPLMDTKRFARGIEEAYRSMWRTWCKTHKA